MAAADESATRDPLSNDSIPAAFWDATPENEGNPDLMAIKALQEESTPEERAESLKVCSTVSYAKVARGT